MSQKDQAGSQTDETSKFLGEKQIKRKDMVELLGFRNDKELSDEFFRRKLQNEDTQNKGKVDSLDLDDLNLLLTELYCGDRADFLRLAKLWRVVTDYEAIAINSGSWGTAGKRKDQVFSVKKNIRETVKAFSERKDSRQKIQLGFLSEMSKIRTEIARGSRLDNKDKFDSRLHEKLDEDFGKVKVKEDQCVMTELQGLDVFEFLDALDKYDKRRSALLRYTLTGLARTNQLEAARKAIYDYLENPMGNNKKVFLQKLANIKTEILDGKSELSKIVHGFIQKSVKDDTPLRNDFEFQHNLDLYDEGRSWLTKRTRGDQLKRIRQAFNAGDKETTIKNIKDEITKEFQEAKKTGDVDSKLYEWLSAYEKSIESSKVKEIKSIESSKVKEIFSRNISLYRIGSRRNLDDF